MFNATKQMQGHRCWKASFAGRESCLMHFKIKAQVHERCFFLMKWNVFAMQKQMQGHRCWKGLSQWEKVA